MVLPLLMWLLLVMQFDGELYHCVELTFSMHSRTLDSLGCNSEMIVAAVVVVVECLSFAFGMMPAMHLDDFEYESVVLVDLELVLILVVVVVAVGYS